MTDFDELAGGDDLTPDETARLRHVHDMLLQAGPPPELPRSLEQPDAPPDEAEVLHFPLRRRLAVTVLAAVAMVIAGFGIGFLVGHSKAKPESFAAERVVSMHGKTPGAAVGVLRVGEKDEVGNWPMQFEVRGLPPQAERNAEYELWLTKDGKPVVSCGTFRVHENVTTVRLSVPYKFSEYDGWVVTKQEPGQESPGTVVMST